MKFKLFIFLIFSGSIFLTSESFVDPYTTVKKYFSIITILIGILIVTVTRTWSPLLKKEINHLSTLKLIFIIGVLQAIYGFLQYFDILPSNNDYFPITGSFDNPAGFAAVLSLIFPVGIYWLFHAKKLEKFAVLCLVSLLIVSIILCESRTGIVAALVSTLIIIFYERQFFSRIRLNQCFKLMILAFIILCCSIFFLYKWKKSSVEGRFLIWKVSYMMFKDKPLLGYGYNGFEANYMNYQAKYFRLNPRSQYRHLADNINHPFNEFIKIAIDYGILGLFFFIFYLLIIVYHIFKSQLSISIIILSTFSSFLIFCSFSYPFQYAPIWLILGYFQILTFKEYFTRFRISPKRKFFVSAICLMAITYLSIRLSYEIKWKSIAYNSLRGQNEKMIPKYEKLYPQLKNDPYFLYNYGAELNVAKKYDKSIKILRECQEELMDYNLQMLIANNYYQNENFSNALSTYRNASYMIPNRFLPLYFQLKIYQKAGDIKNGKILAQEIVRKKVKINSGTVSFIIRDAIDYLKTYQDSDISK